MKTFDSQAHLTDSEMLVLSFESLSVPEDIKSFTTKVCVQMQFKLVSLLMHGEA